MAESKTKTEVAREALRAKLPDNVLALLDAAKDDPGAPFELAAVAMLSKLRTNDAANWQRVRSVLKAIGDVVIGDLDRATAPAGGGDGKQGQPIEWDDPEPWPETVDGAALLGEVSDFMRRYVALPDKLADTVTLWIVVTWIHDRLDVSPFLNVTSATPRCGKSLLVNDVVGELVRRPLPIGSRVSSAYLFRLIELHAPTLLLDEIDTYLRDEPELRGDLNSSQRRSGAYAGRLVPVGDGEFEPRRFSTWCPKVFSGIGGMPDTVLDRSIVVTIKRRPPNVALEGWRDRDKAGVEAMRRKLAQWISDSEADIVARLPAVDFPSGLHDRARDAWEALLAIANEAGGQWAGPEGRALAACRYVAAQSASEETGAREMLLADLRTIFEAEGWPAAIGSKAILSKLVAMEGRRWGEWSREKPLSAHGLSKLLKPFGVQSRQTRLLDGSNLKGFRLDDLRSVWTAYLPDSSIPPGAETKHRNNATPQGISRDPETKHGEGAVSDLDRTKPYETRDCFDVSDLRPPARVSGADSTPASVSLPSQPPGTERAGDAYRRLSRGE